MRISRANLRSILNRPQLVLVGLLLVVLEVGAAITTIDGLRVRSSPERTRVVFDLGRSVSYKIFTLKNPYRVVIDIRSAALNVDVNKVNLSGTQIEKIRSGKRNRDRDIRVVLDVERALRPKSFVLEPIMQYGNRLVIDLYDNNRPEETVVQKSQVSMSKMRDVVVAIDAGHGGDDPGAIGPSKLYEKDIVLGIAKYLEGFFAGEPGFRAVLIRQDDYFIALRKRTEMARENEADLFLSIHADAFKTPNVSGASVYAISEKGGTSETARWLAEKENRSDLIGGVSGSISLDDKDDMLAGVLLDLSMQDSLSSSLEIGENILEQLAKVNKLHKKKVEQANFAVLKSPDIPSLLIESGYISNPGEEKRLGSRAHQKKLARAIFTGVRDSFVNSPPPGSYLAWLKKGSNTAAITYVIEQGDTLSEIASRYQVSFRQLKEFNGLRDDTIHVGQILKIPTG